MIVYRSASRSQACRQSERERVLAPPAARAAPRAGSTATSGGARRRRGGGGGEGVLRRPPDAAGGRRPGQLHGRGGRRRRARRGPGPPRAARRRALGRARAGRSSYGGRGVDNDTGAAIARELARYDGPGPLPLRRRPGHRRAHRARARLGRPEGALAARASSTAPRSGASCSPSPTPGPTSPGCAAGPSATASGGPSPGQKTWSSRAHYAAWGLLLARSDPQVPKHAGITAFGLPMDAGRGRGAAAAPGERRPPLQRGLHGGRDASTTTTASPPRARAGRWPARASASSAAAWAARARAWPASSGASS